MIPKCGTTDDKTDRLVFHELEQMNDEEEESKSGYNGTPPVFTEYGEGEEQSTDF